MFAGQCEAASIEPHARVYSHSPPFAAKEGIQVIVPRNLWGLLRGGTNRQKAAET